MTLSVPKKTPAYPLASQFFLDKEGAMYKRQRNGKHQLVIPETLVQAVIRESHDPIHTAHPGVERTYNLVSLNYWWQCMRMDIEDYVRNCDPCQRHKTTRNPIGPLGVVKPSPPSKLRR